MGRLEFMNITRKDRTVVQVQSSAQRKARREAVWLTRWQSRGWQVRFMAVFGWLFAALAKVRRRWYRSDVRRQVRLPVPVVVVGGIMVGGVGKTPVVAQLVRDLQNAGFCPAIISRGYGGSHSASGGRGDCQAVAVGLDSLASSIGDEPLLLWLNTGVPVWVGVDRTAVGQALCLAHPECDVLVCDDGLQHYRLYRDVELVVMDERGVGNGWCLPAGPLREPPERLQSVSAVIQHVRGREACARVFDWIPQPLSPPVFAVQSALGQAYALGQRSKIRDVSSFVGDAVLCCAAIARPQVFFDMLQAQGVTGQTWALPDHAPFDDALAQAMMAADVTAILMTEKDAVKCLPWVARYPSLAAVIWVVPLSVCIGVDWVQLTQHVVHNLRTITHLR